MAATMNYSLGSIPSLLCAVPTVSPPPSPALPPSPPPLPPLSPPVSPPSQPSASTPSWTILLSVFVGVALAALAIKLWYDFIVVPRGLRLLHEHTTREEGLDDTRRQAFLEAAPAERGSNHDDIVPAVQASSTASAPSTSARGRRSRGSGAAAQPARWQLRQVVRRFRWQRRQMDTQQEMIVAVAANSAAAVTNSSTAMHVATGVRHSLA